MKRFSRFQLRTTNVDAARRFYAKLLGEGVADIVPLPEQAKRRGAPPHWLGQIVVDDVYEATASLTERGAMKLGPIRTTSDGGRMAVMRGPGGAVFGVTTAMDGRRQPSVVWQVMHANEADWATGVYCEVFGWGLGPRRDRGTLGVHQEFSWSEGGKNIGATVDITGRHGIHPHWLFHFRVEALEPAMEVVRAAGGTVWGPMALDNGDRIATCEDPQGAAFTLHECTPDSGEGAT